MRRTLLPSLILCLTSAAAFAQTAPPGWSARPQDGGTLYRPNDLPADLRFDIWVPPPSDVGGAGGMQAFMQIKRAGLSGIDVTGLRPQCADAEVAGNGSITQTCQLLGGKQDLTPARPTDRPSG